MDVDQPDLDADFANLRDSLFQINLHMTANQDESLLHVLQTILQGNMQHGEFIAQVGTFVDENWEAVCDLAVDDENREETIRRIRCGKWSSLLEVHAAADNFRANINIHIENYETLEYPVHRPYARTFDIARFHGRWFNLWRQGDLPDPEPVLQTLENTPMYDHWFKAKNDKHIQVLFFIPKPAYRQGDSLMRCISRTPKFLYLIDFSGKITSEIQKNIAIGELFAVFIIFHRMNDTRDIRKKKDWMADVLFFHLMSSTLKLEWRDKEVELLANYNTQSCKLFSLVKSKWLLRKSSMLDDVELTLDLGEFHFCENCNPDCELKLKAWHMDLADAKELEINPTDTTDILSKIRIFGGVEATKIRMVKCLNRIYASYNHLPFHNRLTRFCRQLDLYHLAGTRKTWFCYVLLLIDDIGQEEDFDLEQLPELIYDDRYRKMIYIGSTQEKNFRKSLFSKDSAVYKAMGPKTRVILIRSNEHLTEDSARMEEAVTIEFFKIRKDIQRPNKRRPTIILLNTNSSTALLKELTVAECSDLWEKIRNTGEDELDRQFNEDGFRLDYSFNPVFNVKYEIEIPDGEYLFRDYAQVDIAYFSFVKNYINAQA